MSLELQGARTSTTLLGTVDALHRQDMTGLALLVLATGFVLPACHIAAVLVMLIGSGTSARRRRPAGAAFRVWAVVRPWAMIDVLVLGILVTLTKLGDVGYPQTGPALWSFAALMVLLALTEAAFDSAAFWATVAPPPRDQPAGLADPLVACDVCGWLTRGGRPPRDRCARCGARLHPRKPDSQSRTVALLLAAAILYVPANLLPVLESGSLFGPQRDTIMSGVAYLWSSGSWLLAVVIFVASVFVPLAKLLGLGLLLISVRWRWRWAPLQRGHLYRAVERIGRWSMLDVFVAALLTAVVQFHPLALIEVGPGAVAFAAVVVLTMSASHTFDPRLIWDALPEARKS